MKLQIEISEYEKDGKFNFSVGTAIVPADKEGISTRDKPKQLAKFDRLTDLSAVIAQTIAHFYHERTMPSPSNPISTSGEPGTI